MVESRIFALLENEVSKGLHFTFCLSENVSRPGSRSLAAGDHFRFQVRARNDCGFRLTDVRGSIDPTELTEFRMLTFDLPEIMPGQDVPIADSGARLISRWVNDPFANIGLVNVSARLDLSGFKFQQWEKPLVHSAPHAPIAEPMRIDHDLGYHRPQPQRAGSAAGRDFWDGQVLPLSRTVDR